jgi:hypothetical protein
MIERCFRIIPIPGKQERITRNRADRIIRRFAINIVVIELPVFLTVEFAADESPDRAES